MDWIQFAIFLSAMVGMFSWLKADIHLQRSESAADRRDLLQIIREIQTQMKDFHGKLERQDADFKSHMIYLHNDERK